MDQGHHHHHHQGQVHHHFTVSNIDPGGGDRFPQWSIQETRDFLIIRAELDPAFMETKRNKLLWEVISTRMKEKGYIRSPDQCKCKWKNLVTRFKGCETMEAEGMRQQQFPFYNELQTIFAARMQRMLWLEAEGGGGGGGAAAASSSKKKTTAQFSSDDEEENEDQISEGEKAKKKRKIKGNINNNPQSSSTTGINSAAAAVINGVKEIMEEYMKQQMQMETQWLKAYETREEERRVKEMEWRQTMEALENERIMMDRRWREREEQRKIREEARADKRDALITALLNKLRRSEDNV